MRERLKFDTSTDRVPGVKAKVRRAFVTDIQHCAGPFALQLVQRLRDLEPDAPRP
jgi:hypothetical protein